MSDTIKEFRNEYFFLSNFYIKPFFYNGNKYLTVEHAFQAAKTVNKADHDKIMNCKTPLIAKQLGRKIKLVEGWDEIKNSIMLDILRCKFNDSVLKKWLIKTGDKEIQEGNFWGDKYWGVCLKTREGKNVLGKLLMKIRDEVKM